MFLSHLLHATPSAEFAQLHLPLQAIESGLCTRFGWSPASAGIWSSASSAGAGGTGSPASGDGRGSAPAASGRVDAIMGGEQYGSSSGSGLVAGGPAAVAGVAGLATAGAPVARGSNNGAGLGPLLEHQVELCKEPPFGMACAAPLCLCSVQSSWLRVVPSAASLVDTDDMCDSLCSSCLCT